MVLCEWKLLLMESELFLELNMNGNGYDPIKSIHYSNVTMISPRTSLTNSQNQNLKKVREMQFMSTC
ncbi:hypothetical protein KHA96_15140 [Bacillus sp. FJAT-49711]|uniref:hypothetical protein n=1 Tax=Bacillus sp. FJAT-49711 TaxID=2833585 RepID=UPI001BC98A91|nr:hypothetical protein [Bacillus sp. FJAT-49711]MBS4219649.1 hypothetical protein [Bacillus sp. FJAT-49711]